MHPNSPVGTPQRQKLIVIVGPTASGKSALAVRIARFLLKSHFNRWRGTEIISADSRQVYRGLDIGSGKVQGNWKPYRSSTSIGRRFIYRGIAHHCIDFVSPRRTYSVAEFQRCATTAIQNIGRRGSVPILVGGTGLWINAVAYGWQLPHAPPDAQLRARLNKKTTAQLLSILKRLDPKRAKTVEQKNQRRLIRAIEVATALGSVPELKKRAVYDTLIIGLNPTAQTLEKRIRNRARRMIREGFISEVKKLRALGISKKRIREFGFEYRAGLEYLDGTLSKTELLQRFTVETRQYAKRQMTWFRRNPDIIWNPSARETDNRITSLLI